MQYREMGNTGLKLSALGFGCMRLPKTDDADGNKIIDVEASHELFRRAMALGVNYFDTAYMYDNGGSERCLGAFLGQIDRSQVVISTKNPVGHQWWQIPGHTPTATLWRQCLEEELERLGTDYIDIYLFHDTALLSFRIVNKGPDAGLAQALKARDEGLIRHVAFSSHDSPANIQKIIDMGDGAFDFMIVQYNLLDKANEPAIAHAADNGMGVGVMGPVGGGRLVHPSEVYRKATGAASTPEAAIRFVLANPHVTSALSGMNAPDQVAENCAAAARSDTLSAADLQAIADIEEQNRGLLNLYCTGCGYCLPCKHGVDIPGNFRAMNTLRVNCLVGLATQMHLRLKDGVAANCENCGECAGKCPQDIDIPARLEEVAAAFDAL